MFHKKQTSILSGTIDLDDPNGLTGGITEIGCDVSRRQHRVSFIHWGLILSSHISTSHSESVNHSTDTKVDWTQGRDQEDRDEAWQIHGRSKLHGSTRNQVAARAQA